MQQMAHINSAQACTRRRRIGWKCNWNSGAALWDEEEENNMLVQRQLIWNTAPNHRRSRHFTLIFCLSNNLLQNSTIDLQSTQSFLGKIHSWLHHRHWLDTTAEKPDGSNHLQPGGRRIEKKFFKRRPNFDAPDHSTVFLCLVPS